MSNVALVVEEILVISAEITKLTQDEAPLRERLTQIEIRRSDLKAQIASLVSAGHATPGMTSPGVSEASPTRKKRPFASTGFIGELLSYLREHPGQEVTPEYAANAVRQPSKNGLAGTCLKRLADAGLIDKPRTGHYVYLDSQSASLRTEAPMT